VRDGTFSRFHRTPACDGQTHRYCKQKDGQTQVYCIYRANIASHGKNYLSSSYSIKQSLLVQIKRNLCHLSFAYRNVGKISVYMLVETFTKLNDFLKDLLPPGG